MPVLPRPLLQWPEKDPAELLDYALNFAPVFDSNPASPTGDTIQSVVWTVPADLTLHQQLVSGNVAVAWLSGGQSGAHYMIRCVAASLQGRTGTLAAELPVRTHKAL